MRQGLDLITGHLLSILPRPPNQVEKRLLQSRHPRQVWNRESGEAQPLEGFQALS